MITYKIHNYAGVEGDDRIVTVEGAIEKLLPFSADGQKTIGITILCSDCGKDYFESETILANGELGCSCGNLTHVEADLAEPAQKEPTFADKFFGGLGVGEHAKPLN
jgi:hypothetical protein